MREKLFSLKFSFKSLFSGSYFIGVIFLKKEMYLLDYVSTFSKIVKNQLFPYTFCCFGCFQNNFHGKVMKKSQRNKIHAVFL